MILLNMYHGVCVLNIIAVSPPATWDAAGASRVLQGTQQMYRQYNRFSKDRSKPSVLLPQPPSSSFSSSSQSSNSINEPGSSSCSDSSSSGSTFGATSALLESNMEDLEEEEAEEQSNMGLTASQTQSTAAAAVKGSFDQRWQQQAKKGGLIGALVAMAYPDRIAQKKVRGFRLNGL